MRRAAATLAAVAAAATCASTAHADLAVGVADDRGKYAEDGGASFFGTLRELGLAENRITVQWDASRPTTIVDKPFLDRSLPRATASGTRVVLAVYPSRPTGVTATPDGAAQFAAFAAQLARTYPQVKHFVIGNEPNQPRFWQPQFGPDGSRAAAATFFETLWRAYDALKAVDPAIRVIGIGLSERGNDNPSAPSNASTSPVRFLRDLGAAYRASGRTAPLMDELDFHPYPESPRDPLDARVRLAEPSASGTSTGSSRRSGTPSPAPGSRRSRAACGCGSARPAGRSASSPPPPRATTAAENVPVTDEAAQAEIYGQLVRRAACDPAITAVHLFGLVDEPDLDRFQAAFLRADGSRRPAFDAVRAALAETGGRCTGTPVTWRHATTVVGGAASFGDLGPSFWKRTAWSFGVTAAEEATFRAGIHRLPANAEAARCGAAGAASDARAGRALGGRDGAGALDTARRLSLAPPRTRHVRLPRRARGDDEPGPDERLRQPAVRRSLALSQTVD